MKRSTRHMIVIVLAAITLVAVFRDQPLAAALLGAVTGFAVCWSMGSRPVRIGGRTTSRPVRLPGASTPTAKGYTAAAVVAFACATPALLIAVGDHPSGWLDGLTSSPRLKPGDSRG